MNKTIKIVNKERIDSIDYMKLICSFLVVMIHTNPFKEYSEGISYICLEIIPRIAVPFFFTTSGYFYINSLNKNNHVFFKYLKRLLSTYILWSIIYFSIRFIESFKYDINLKGFIVDCIYQFFWLGPYYHLWYFPALILCVLLVTLFNRYGKLKILYFISITLYIIGVLGCSYYEIGIHIPLLSKLYQLPYFSEIRRPLMIGIPFFMVGGLIEKLKVNPNKLFIVSLILFVGEIFLVNKFNIQKNIVITIFLYPLVLSVFTLCLKYPMNKHIKCAKECRLLSSFIYYVHPIVILLLVNIFKLPETPTYFITCCSSFVLGLLIIKIDNEYINKLL